MIATGAGKLRPALGESSGLGKFPGPPQHVMEPLKSKATGRPADFNLQIAPMMVELAPQVVISTIGYNNKVPGPLLRTREGRSVTVDVVNDTDVPEYVHWHGLFVPPEVDGVEEEGTPPVPPHGTRRYQFVAKPAGSRWYHSHTAAMMDLHRGSYTGQFGFFMIDPANDPGRYDQEVFLALREWQYFLSTMDQDEMGADPGDSKPERPATLDLRPNGLEVSAPLYSINDKMLGAGEPLRVRSGQRVLVHLLNASAAQIHRVALPGHKFQVIALDGNPVPAPQAVEVIEIAPGERVDAIVEMNNPGVWILGEIRNAARQSGWALSWNMPINSSARYGLRLRGRAGTTPFLVRARRILCQTRPSTWSLRKCLAAPMESITGSSTAKNIRMNENLCCERDADIGWCSTIAATILTRCISTDTCSNSSNSTASRLPASRRIR